VRQFGIPIKLSQTPGAVRSASPLPGEHTKETLAQLGLDAAKIAELSERGIVGDV